MSKTVYFLEYGPIDDSFHIDTLSSILQYNTKFSYNRQQPVFVIIEGPFDSYEQAQQAILKHPELAERVRLKGDIPI